MSIYDKHDKQIIIELLPIQKLTEAAHRWQKLEQQIENKALTNTWTWIHTWLAYYGETVQPTFAFGRREDEIVGATLLTQSSHTIAGIPIPALYLGTAGEPEHETAYVENNRMLVSSENQSTFTQALIHTLEQRLSWSELRLHGFVPEQAETLLQAGTDANLHFRIEKKGTPIFDFHKAQQEGHQDIIAALGNSTRYNIRRSLRLFERQFGPQHCEMAQTPEQAKKILQELIHMHSQRWQSVKDPGAFQTERVKHYHEGLIDALGLWPDGRLIVFRVKYGDTTIGCLFNFIDQDGHVMSYKSGFPLFDDNKLKPGQVAHILCMEECKRHNLSRYDFLVGDALYKDQLANTESHLIWATAGRGVRASLPWLIDLATPTAKCLKEKVQNLKIKK